VLELATEVVMTVLEFIVDESVELEVVAEVAMTVSEFVVDRTMTEVEADNHSYYSNLSQVET
jgi:hypothetical protein